MTSVTAHRSRTAPSITTAEDQPGHSLQKDQQGQGVAELQKLLNTAGASLAVDGDFGPKTDRAVRAFQRGHGLAVDGKAGMHTLHALRAAAAAAGHGDHTVGALRAPTDAERTSRPSGSVRAGDMQDAQRRTTGFSPAQGRAAGRFSTSKATREAQAEQLLKKQGVALKEGHTYVLQIDQDPPKRASSSFMRSYTGQTVVMQAHGGTLQEVGGPYKSSSHPAQLRPVGSDGVPGTAFIRPGAYEYTKSTHVHHGKERFDPLENMPAARDLNHDGTITGSENDKHYTAGAIQWHPGNSSSPSSTGCQNIDPSQWQSFRAAVKAGGGTFTYVLARRPNDVTGANPF